MAGASELLEQLFPLVVPAKLFGGGVPVAQHVLSGTGFVLAWGVRSQPNAFMYLTVDQAKLLDESKAPWQRTAMQNMVHGKPVNTHERSRASGKLLWCGLMHDDAFGSSRTLLAPAWRRLFPGGYRIALPDRSCGMVLAADITKDEDSEMREMISQMYARAKTPMSDALFEADALALPEAWYP